VLVGATAGAFMIALQKKPLSQLLRATLAEMISASVRRRIFRRLAARANGETPVEKPNRP
jgi:hypothetical protein